MDNFCKSLMGRPNTIRARIALYRNQIEPYLHKFTDYDEVMVRQMVREWLDKELKPNTIKSCISVLKQFILYKTGRNVDCKQIVRTISKMEQSSDIKTWTQDEVRKILATAKVQDKDMYKLLIVAFNTGVRKGELLGLRWTDIDFIQGTIKIQRSFDGPTKTGRSRVVPMSNLVENLLQSDYIVGADSRVFSVADPRRRLRQLCRKAGVPVMSFHSTRHFFATEALKAGRSPREVAHILGHASVAITLSTYWSLTGNTFDMSFLDFMEEK